MPADDAPPDALPEGTLTFVLTDIEGSTPLWDDDPAAMTAAERQHDALIAAAVAANGGRLVKSKGEGDSTFSVFVDPSAAVTAAEAMRDTIQAATWPTASPIRVRVGVLTGVAELRDGDYYGVAINRAARVRSLARGGEVLMAASTYSLIADSLLRNRVIEDRGEYELRGLQRPERVYALRDGTDPPATIAPPRSHRGRAVAITGVCALVVLGVGGFVWARHSGGKSASAAETVTSTTTRKILATNKPTVEISTIKLVSAHDVVRYEVAGVFSSVKIPPYEIRVVARPAVATATWLWSPPAQVATDGRWSGVLDVPSSANGSSALSVSAIAIISGPVSGVTPSGPPGAPTTTAITLPASPAELAYERALTTLGPRAPGVIAVSSDRPSG